MEMLIIIGLALLSLFLLFLLLKANKTQKTLKQRYQGIQDIDQEIQNRKSAIDKEEHEANLNLTKLKKDLDDLKQKYEVASSAFETLSKENQLLKDNLDIAEFGVYEPHFELDSSEEYKNKIKENKEDQKFAIKIGTAVKCHTNWSVGNSQKQGEIMTRRSIKLTTRAFNGECDSLIAKVKWNNIEQYEKRIIRAFEAINKLNKSNDIHIQEEYLQLKIDELRLVHEYEVKKQAEKEVQRQIREQMREEEKARRDFEKAQKEAAKEEKILQQAMKKAQEEVARATDEEREKYEAQLLELQTKLNQAEVKNQRAISMAQQTKSGHVYVISNIGSFGENIYKIGMTRRLEPLDRVKELGDASVPFKFDVHAMIYSDNAPELENRLHKAFNHKRVNHINLRREYFNISLDEIEQVVVDNHGQFEFIKEAEAKEYRESLIIKQKLDDNQDQNVEAFPSVSHLFN